MEDIFQPVTRLKALLGPPPIHPWAGLIPQVLLWAFRRFCIENLKKANEQSLGEVLWEDHLELIRNYAPKGLETITISWMTPENLMHLHSPLEAYNEFFVDFVRKIDVALVEDDDELQEQITDFLDTQLRKYLHKWLSGEQHEFFIFPTHTKDENEFTDIQFMHLIQSLLRYTQARKVEEVAALNLTEPAVAAPEPAAAVAPPEPEDTFEDVLPAPEPAPAAEPEPAAAPAASAPGPAAAAMAARRRLTYRRHGHRANRGCTLRTHRVRTQTRRMRASDS